MFFFPALSSDAVLAVESMPTRVGDVLILCTTRSFTAYTGGRVSKDGQQGFYSAMEVKFLHTKATAKAQAKALVGAKGRIFFRDIDIGKWAKIST